MRLEKSTIGLIVLALVVVVSAFARAIVWTIAYDTLNWTLQSYPLSGEALAVRWGFAGAFAGSLLDFALRALSAVLICGFFGVMVKLIKKGAWWPIMRQALYIGLGWAALSYAAITIRILAVVIND